MIERDDRGLFYATGTGEMAEPTWKALKADSRKFNVVAMDHILVIYARQHGYAIAYNGLCVEV